MAKGTFLKTGELVVAVLVKEGKVSVAVLDKDFRYERRGRMFSLD